MKDSNQLSPDPKSEPSVLDYVKSRLRFWKVDENRSLPSPFARAQSAAAVELPPIGQAAALAPELAGSAEIASPSAQAVQAEIPWRSGLAVLLALLAQMLLEPSVSTARSGVPGAAFYLLSAFAAFWAVRSGEWRLPSAPPDRYIEDPLTIHTRPLIAGGVLLLVSFLLFGRNQFNPLNTTLWLAGVILLARSLWLDEPRPAGWRQRLSESLEQLAWKRIFSPSLLAALAVILLALFFRAYRLDAVPPEMNSDHAEKLLDVYDVLNGQSPIFFERNTGREAFQFYLTALVALVFGTGVSFISLKIGTLLCGLATLPFIYLLGKETAGRWAGWLAVTLAAIAYWPNVITRVALRFSLYPLIAAPTLYFLLRGLRTQRRNDFILAGLALGIGLHTYTPVRIVPLVVVAAFALYLLHNSWLRRTPAAPSDALAAEPALSRLDLLGQALVGLVVIGLVSFAIFIPLGRYALDHPDAFAFRAFSRLGDWERPLPAPAWQIFLQNLWNALRMFSWDNGQIWPVSIPNRPALDVVSGAFFHLGVFLLFVRYLLQRRWQDLFLLLSIPLLMLPSILALAFPAENPALNRTSGALVPVFVIAGLSLYSFLHTLNRKLGGQLGLRLAWLLGLVLLFLSARQNYDLVFKVYYESYAQASWNTAEMGGVIHDYASSIGSLDSAWVVAYPHWVDTRLVGMQAGNVTRDYAIQPADLPTTLDLPNPKLFLVKPDDQGALAALQQLYPQGWSQVFVSDYANKDFVLFFVPSSQDSTGSPALQDNSPQTGNTSNLTINP